MPEQASLVRSGVPLDSLLEGHSLWDLALIVEGVYSRLEARIDLCAFSLQNTTDNYSNRKYQTE